MLEVNIGIALAINHRSMLVKLSSQAVDVFSETLFRENGFHSPSLLDIAEPGH